MEMHILDKKLNTVGIIDRVAEFTLKRHYFTPAVLKLILPRGKYLPDGAEYLYDALSGECLIITAEKLSADGLLTVNAVGAESLLSRRIIKGERVFSGNAETAVRSAASEALAGDSSMPHIRIGDELCGLTESGQYTAYWDVLSEWLYETLRPMGASYKITLDPESRYFVFRVIKGFDRTPAQTERASVVLSDSLGNLCGGEITRDRGSFFNVAYVVGADGTVAEAVSGSSVGEDRREVYISARDIFKKSFETDAEYVSALTQRGLVKLYELSEKLSLKGSADGSASGEYVCGRHYDLGDLCRVGFGGAFVDLRVISVTERRTGGVRELTPIFGN